MWRWNSSPLASIMSPSFFMTSACLQGWMATAMVPWWGKLSTVAVFFACSALTSSKI